MKIQGDKMKISVGMHSNKRVWYRYFKVKWLNCVSHEPGDPKIYRWLWFAIMIEKK